jgi:hypothetical protein
VARTLWAFVALFSWRKSTKTPDCSGRCRLGLGRLARRLGRLAWRLGMGRSRAWARRRSRRRYSLGRPPLRTTPTMVAVIRITATDTIRALSPCLCVRPARHPGTCALRELAPVKTSAPSHRAHIIAAPAKRLSPERGSPSLQVLMVRVAAVISPSVM